MDHHIVRYQSFAQTDENRDQVGEAILHLLALTKLVCIVEVGVHASPEFVAAFPERTVELTFLDRHAKLPPPALYDALV
jgi:hypothetical protein